MKKYKNHTPTLVVNAQTFITGVQYMDHRGGRMSGKIWMGANEKRLW